MRDSGINSQTMRKPWIVSPWLVLSMTSAYCQRSATRVTLPVSPECVDAAQSSGPFPPPQGVFVDNPKPYSFPGTDSGKIYFDLTVRIVTARVRLWLTCSMLMAQWGMTKGARVASSICPP